MLPVSLIPGVLPVATRRVAETIMETVDETTVETDEKEVETKGDIETKEANAVDTKEGDDDIVVEEDKATHMQQHMTLRELKDMCLSRDLSTSGRKVDLVARVLAHDRSKAEGE